MMGSILYQQTRKLVSSVALSYRKQAYTISQDISSLPSREVIIETIHQLRELLFPGYFGKQNLNPATMEYHIGDQILSVHEKLQTQITFVLQRQANRNNVYTLDVKKKANEITCAFLGKIPAIRDCLATDVQAAFDSDPAAEDKDEIIFSYPGILAISIYRLAHELYLLSVPLIPRIMTEYAHSITGIDIHPGATIGQYFFIDHGTGVVIGETTWIGNNVKIYQGVTLGALSTREGQNLRGLKRHPTIEDDVTVYSGASILGGDTVIGKGVVIGSNVFITRSVPDRTKVSVKNPELLFKDGQPQEFKQEFIPDWVI